MVARQCIDDDRRVHLQLRSQETLHTPCHDDVPALVHHFGVRQARAYRDGRAVDPRPDGAAERPAAHHQAALAVVAPPFGPRLVEVRLPDEVLVELVQQIHLQVGEDVGYQII